MASVVEMGWTRPRQAVGAVQLDTSSLMLAYLLFAMSLVAATVVVHAVALAIAYLALMKIIPRRTVRIGATTWIIVCVTIGLIGIHLFEIAIWAGFFWWHECLPDIESSLYFSGVTYATIGYGDIVLPKEWRLFGPLEGLVGILMSGLSVGFFVALLSNLYRARGKQYGIS